MEERCYYPVVEADQSNHQASSILSSSVAFGAPDGLSISKRITPPTHYTLEIESFTLLRSMLARLGEEKYKSRIFEAGGYKWKLSLYPDGNKKTNGEGFISMYVELADIDNLPLGLSIHAIFTFFIYDYIRDNYLSIQYSEGRERRFHKTKTEHGFSRLISLTTFDNASNGYLVDDSCEFGVEVFVVGKRSKGECLRFWEPDGGWYFSWDIPNFSALTRADCYSIEFPAGGRKWRYTERLQRKIDKNSSKGCNVYVECRLRVVDSIHGNYVEKTVYGRYSDSCSELGIQEFMLLSDIHDQSKGFLVNDALVVLSKFDVICATEDLS